MTVNQLPVAFLVGGFVLKGFLVVVWRFSKIPELLSLLTTYDPGAFWFAEKTAALLLDRWRIAPTATESVAFGLLLVVGFGIECLLVGLVMAWLLRRPKQRPEDIGSGSPVTGG